MITVEQGLSTETETALLQGLLSDLAAAGVDAAGFSPFSVTAALPALVAKALAYHQVLRADVLRLSFLELLVKAGADEWIDKVVKAWFGIDRIAATKARGLFKVTAAGGLGTVTCGARSQIAEAGAVQFDNLAEFTISGGQSLYREFECRTAGALGNVLPGAVTGFKVGKAGLTVANETGWLVQPGRDKERNADYAARGRARFATLAPGGARAAYLYWVPKAFEAAALPTSVTKIGVDDTNPNGPGSTDLYLANAAGGATPTEIATVNAFLQERRGLGTGPLRVLAAPEVTIPISGTLYSTSASAVADAIAKLEALRADLELGGGPKHKLYLDAIRGAVLGPDGVPGVYKFDVGSPTGDTNLSAFEVVSFTYALSLVLG